MDRNLTQLARLTLEIQGKNLTFEKELINRSFFLVS